MGRGDRLLQYTFAVDVLLILVSISVGSTNNSLLIGGGLILLLIAATGRSWVTYRSNQIQPRSEDLRTLLESEVLPRLHKNAQLAHPDEIPGLRANVMLHRWRGANPFRNDVWIWPWQRTLQIEAAHVGDSARDYGAEADLEWTTNQGVVGDAMNERAQEVWTQPGYTEIDPTIKWNLSQTQHAMTSHVNSVLSVPIYLPSDEDKVNPVGVVTLDSSAPPETAKLHDDDLEIRKEAIYWSNVIGAIVE